MTKKEKVLVSAAIESFMKDQDEPGEWEDGMDILSYLIGRRSTTSRKLVKRIWADYKKKQNTATTPC